MSQTKAQLVGGVGFSTADRLTIHNGLVVTGVVTATSFDGAVVGDATGLTGSPNIDVTNITASGNVTIGGTLTYEDVTNIDSIGIVTARSGIHVTGGNVGIGTDNPDTILHLSSSNDTALTIADTSVADTHEQVVLMNNSGNFNIRTHESDGSFKSIDYIINRGASGATTHVWRIENSEVMRVDSAGRLGIGTNAPGSLLTVQASGTQQALLSARANAGAGGGMTIQTDASDDGLLRLYDSTGAVKVQLDTDGGDNYIALGKIGIGTVAPNRQLALYNSVAPVLQLVNNTTGTTANDGTLLYGSGSDFIIENQEAGNVRIQSNGSEWMRIASDGTATFNGNVTLNANLDMQDNDKILLGTGDDLQIYHDGSNSYIDDAGTGNLQIRGSSQVKIQKYTGENMFVGIADGAASMYYNNSQKIATKSDGIDVTGEVQCDSLDVDGNGDISGTLTVGAISGNVFSTVTATATSKTVINREYCAVTASGRTITLPASPSAGDEVVISVGNFTDTIIARNGSNIMGLAENITVDVAYVAMDLVYIDATRGWRIS